MSKLRIFYLFFFFFLFNSTYLFSGLLPGTIIFVLGEQSRPIKELRPGNAIVSFDETSNHNQEALVSGLKIDRNFLDKIIFIK